VTKSTCLQEELFNIKLNLYNFHENPFLKLYQREKILIRKEENRFKVFFQTFSSVDCHNTNDDIGDINYRDLHYGSRASHHVGQGTEIQYNIIGNTQEMITIKSTQVNVT
jgi:hypothetical protein